MVVTPFFPSKNSFVGSYVFDQVSEIKNQSDFNIKLVKVVSFFSKEQDYIFKDFRISIFKMIDFPFFILPGLFNWLNKRRFKIFLNNKKITNIKFTHCHVSYPSSYLVEDLNCYKIIQHHGLDVLQLLNGRNNLFKNLQKNYLISNSLKHLNKANLNIGVSQLVLDKLNEFDSYCPNDEIVLYNGVDTNKFFPINLVKNKIFTIGCVGNFWKTKDQIILIKAIKKLREEGFNLYLRLIGSGQNLNACKDFVNNNNLSGNIFF